MKERIVVAKFGGTSVADAGQVRKISDIVRSDPARRFIVVSAPGKRFSDDIKVTDLLLDLYEKAKAGQPIEAELRQIKMRFREIIDGLGISFPSTRSSRSSSGHLRLNRCGTTLPAAANTSLPK